MPPVSREDRAAGAAAAAREHGRLVLLGGPPGAGKSAVGEIVAAAAPCPTVHLRNDSFYAWIRSGFVPPYLPEAEEQNRTVTVVMTASATAYARGGYDVIADGIIGPWLLPAFLAACEPDGIAVSCAVLRPSLEVTLARAARTGGQLTDPGPVTGLHRAFTRLGGLESHVIDSTAQTPGQTAAELTAALSRSELAEVTAAAARAAGCRAVISSGWAGLALPGSDPGCLVTGEVNQQRLFTRVAAVVHHGGAGTTTTAALAGTPR